jgi:hypothetical protein
MPLTMKEILSPRNYIPAFLKIRDKNANLVQFKFNKAQRFVLDKIEDLKRREKPVRLILLKARQLGMSTFSEGYIFNDTATNPLKTSIIVAHEDSASQNLYQMYKTFYENLPPELTPMTKYSNAQEMLFENPTNDIDDKRKNPGLQSKVRVASARNVSTGRSMTIHNLHASEVAFWQDAKTLMTGLMQTIPDTPNTSVIIESTANGVGGYFYDMCMQAMRGENDFTLIFLPWYLDEGYTMNFNDESERDDFIKQVSSVTKDNDGNDIHTEEWEIIQSASNDFGIDITYEQLNWRRYTIRNKCNNDIEMFHQEYPSTPMEAFVASGRPRFSISTIRKYLKQAAQGVRGYLEWVEPLGERYTGQHVRFVEDPKGYIELWKKPEEDKFYCIGADVAEGLINGDYSTGLVYDWDFNIVATWHGHIDPDLFGEELVKLGAFYNEAYLGIEVNNHGLTTIKAVQRLEYWNIYYQKTFDKLTEKVTQSVGWKTTTKTKPLMIDKLAEFIREGYIGIKSKDLLMECLTYVIDDKGATNAQDGCYDDLVMGAAIGLQLCLEGKGESFTPEVPKESKRANTYNDEPSYGEHNDDDNGIEIAL